MEHKETSPWNDDSFKIYNKNEESAPYENIDKLAAHAFLYCKTNAILFGHIPMKHAIMMQLRFDGKMGFPGGLIEKDEEVVLGLNRELHEELGLMEEFFFSESDYLNSWITPTFIDHFYVKKYSEKEFKMIESGCLKAKDWGGESLGIIRVPVHCGNIVKADPFGEFLKHHFVSNSQSELIEGILSQGIIDKPVMSRIWNLNNAK